ncbi:MAG: hypothetical protein ACXABY_21350 [Candidatus Thorarchaeota archaeon]|jgi:hypothetical protein
MTVRLGRVRILEEKLEEAREIGAMIEQNHETVKAYIRPGEILFSALRKGDSDVWIFQYNDKYYEFEPIASGSKGENPEEQS